MKTQKELDRLKQDWIKDPCWDIEDTKGFEDHHDELLAWRQAYKAEQEALRNKRDTEQAIKMGLTLEEYRKMNDATSFYEHSRSLAAQLLGHYFSFSLDHMDSDNYAEFEEIADHIIAATIAKMTANAIENKASKP